MAAGRFADAAGAYETLVAAQPDSAYFRYWLGLAHLGAGACGAALDRQPEWGEAHIALARADALCGNPETRHAAVERARQLVEARDDADTRITLAFAEHGVGRLDAARSIAAGALPHADAAMLLDALATNARTPLQPFAADSDWWLPAELR